MSDVGDKGLEAISDLSVIEASKDFFFDGFLLPVNVYLKVSAGNYLVIGRQGEKSNFSSLHSYQKSGTTIFVRKQDYPTLIQSVSLLTEKFVGKKDVPNPVKMKFLSGLAEDALSTLNTSGFSSVSKIQRVSGLLVQMSQTISSFEEILKIIESLRDEEVKHSMTTCLIGMMICEEMNVTLPAALEKVSLGSLLHDVGLKFVPKDILDKPRHLWSAAEVQTYEQHPIKAVETLRHIKDLSNDVLLIIVEHHENSLGTGFPKKLRDVKISPLGRIVALANTFSDLICSGKPNSKVYTPDDAIKYIEDILGQPFNKQVFAALKNIINKKYLTDKAG